MLFQYMERVVTFREKIDMRKSDALNPGGETPCETLSSIPPPPLCERFGVNKRNIMYLLYGKQFFSLNRVFWLVSLRSEFYSTDHYHGNGPFWIFCFRTNATAKFKLWKRKKIKKEKVWSWYKTNERGKHVCLEKAIFN